MNFMNIIDIFECINASNKWLLEEDLHIGSDWRVFRQERKKSLSQGLGMRYTAEVRLGFVSYGSMD